MNGLPNSRSDLTFHRSPVGEFDRSPQAHAVTPIKACESPRHLAAGVTTTVRSLTDMAQVIEDWEATLSAKIGGATVIGL
jgi:hypothetical protein